MNLSKELFIEQVDMLPEVDMHNRKMGHMVYVVLPRILDGHFWPIYKTYQVVVHHTSAFTMPPSFHISGYILRSTGKMAM